MKYLSVFLPVIILLGSCAGSQNYLVANLEETNPLTESIEQSDPVAQEKAILVLVPVEKKASVYFSDGSLDEYLQSSYDDSDRFLQQQQRFSASGVLLEQTEYLYENNLLSSRTLKDADARIIVTRTYVYDQNDKLLKEIVSEGTGRRISSSEYRYDENGNRVTWMIMDANEKVIVETRYIYKELRLDRAEILDNASRKTGSISYFYDDAGLLQKQEYRNLSDELIRSEHFNWHSGLLQREERLDAVGKIQDRISYEYGDTNELVRKTIEDFIGKSEQYIEYEYDFREEHTSTIN